MTLREKFVFHILSGRWWIGEEVWYPAILICDLFGHGEETWHDGPWCSRCGSELDY